MLVTRANQYVDQTAPFKLAKDPAQAKRLDEVLYTLAETCRILAVLAVALPPRHSCQNLLPTGPADAPDKFSKSTWGVLTPGHRIGAPAPAVPQKRRLRQ